MPRTKLAAAFQKETDMQNEPQRASSTGRTSREEKVNKRVPINGFRDILTVEGKDPAFHYCWVYDESESGARIFQYHNAGYEFANADDHRVGASFVHKLDSLGSIIRTSAGVNTGGYLYLMRIPRELYEEDQRAIQKQVSDLEASMANPSSDEGQYGMLKGNRAVEIER